MPMTIDVPVTLSEKTWTVAQIARDLGVRDRSNCQRYVTRLTDNGHKAFRDYAQGEPLTEEQRSVVIEYRRLSKEEGKKGDPLWRAIVDYPKPPSFRPIALAEVCDRYQVPSDLIDQMVQEITEIFEL